MTQQNLLEKVAMAGDRGIMELPSKRYNLLTQLGAARFLGVSGTTFKAWDAGGQVPDAITVGVRRFWVRAELIDWLDAGAPTREQWAAMRKMDKARR